MNERNVRLVKVLKASIIGVISVLIGSIAFTTGFQAEKHGGK
jgi:hypothetical protein